MIAALDAVLWPEVEARAGEKRWRDHARVDVNHLLTARNHLLMNGLIARSQDPARGGRAVVTTYHLPLARGNQTRIARTSGRKRLLYARWLGWAVGDARYPSGFVGVGGERVVRASLAATRPGLYFPAERDFGPVSHVLGDKVDPGSLDSAAWMIPRTGGIAGKPVLVPIEVKNLREWLFPHSHQVYQVLAKAAAIQGRNPDERVAPLLICRRKHIQTLFMAKDLGFMVVEVKRQFLLPSAEYTAEDVEEVRSGIGFDYLTVSDQADPLLVRVLNDTLPYRVEQLAQRWRTHGAEHEALYHTLASDDLSTDERDEALEQLRTDVAAHPDVEGGW